VHGVQTLARLSASTVPGSREFHATGPSGRVSLQGMKFLGVLIGVALLALAPKSAAAESKQFRIATLAPTGSPWMQLLEKAAIEIAERTDKRVTIKYYAGGQQGDERDFIRKIKLGQLDGAAVTAMGLAQIDPSILVLQMPMLFATLDEVDYVAGKMWPHFQKKFEDKGFRLGDRGEVGWIYFFSKEKVTTLSDLRKQKLPLLGTDELGTSVSKKLNLNGIPLGIPEIDAALTSGRINACFSSPLGAIALQWHTKVKYMTSIPMVYAIGATVFSLEAVKSVSSDDQKTIETLAKRNQKKARAVIRKANDDSQRALVKKGITVVEPSKEMVTELTALAIEAQTELAGKLYSKEELAMVIKYRDEFRAKQANK
jgi:TRAP-type transport system periplasmic protein